MIVVDNLFFVLVVFSVIFIINFIDCVYLTYYCNKKHLNNDKSECIYWHCPHYFMCEYNNGEGSFEDYENDKFNR